MAGNNMAYSDDDLGGVEIPQQGSNSQNMGSATIPMGGGLTQSQPKDIDDMGGVEIDSSPDNVKEYKRKELSEKLSDLDVLKKEHPNVYKMAEYVSQHPSLQKALGSTGDFSEKYINKPMQASGLPVVAGGMTQGAYNTSRSVYNLGADPLSYITGKNFSAPKANFRDYYPKDMNTSIMFGAGEIAPYAMAYTNLMNSLSKIGPMARTIPGSMARGAVAGGAIGQDQDNSRKVGALTGAGGGLLEGLTPQGGLNQINREALRQESAHSVRYKAISDEAAKLPETENITISKQMSKDLKKMRTSNKFLDRADIEDSLPGSIKKVLSGNNYENMHKLQSDLAVAIRKGDRTRDMVSSERDALRLAKSLRKDVRESIKESFKKSGRSDLADEYQNVTDSYFKNVVPYKSQTLKASRLPKYTPGRITPYRAMKQIKGNDTLYSQLYDRHSKVLSESIPFAAKWGGGVTTALAASYLVKELGLKDAIDSMLGSSSSQGRQ